MSRAVVLALTAALAFAAALDLALARETVAAGAVALTLPLTVAAGAVALTVAVLAQPILAAVVAVLAVVVDVVALARENYL